MVLKCPAKFTDPQVEDSYYGALYRDYEAPNFYNQLMKLPEIRIKMAW
jgi:hypothetical protein